jgi:hypothetical protein
MIRNLRSMKTMAMVAIALGCAALSGAALAQQEEGPGGPPPPGGPGGPPGRPGPGRPGGPMGMMGPLTVLQVPPPVLDRALQLTDDQKEKIRQIHQEFDQARRNLMPPPPEPGSPPPDPATMRTAMEKMRALDREASQHIEALLSSDQKKALAKLLRSLNDFRTVGIPQEVVPQLKLTEDQMQKIDAIAQKAEKAIQQILQQAQQGGGPRAVREKIMPIQREAHEAAMALLTDSQHAQLDAFIKSHPRPGGPGGPPPFGGPGGPPPPGGPGGPPDPPTG